jgi:hypothetical protein
MEAVDATLSPDTFWFNPLTMQTETTGAGGRNPEPADPPAPPPSEAFETRPAVETVGQPMAGTPERNDDPFSEFPEGMTPKSRRR